MKFFALATLATTAFALKARQDYDNCLTEWEWDDCIGGWWQYDDCNGLSDCGWWVSPEIDDEWGDDWWMTCDDWSTWECGEYECPNEWYFDDAWNTWWRDPCEGEGETDCGWIYWDAWYEEEYWVDCSWYYWDE